MRIVDTYRVVIPGQAPASFFQRDRAMEYARRYDGTVFARVYEAWTAPGELLPRGQWKWRMERQA